MYENFNNLKDIEYGFYSTNMDTNWRLQLKSYVSLTRISKVENGQRTLRARFDWLELQRLCTSLICPRLPSWILAPPWQFHLNTNNLVSMKFGFIIKAISSKSIWFYLYYYRSPAHRGQWIPCEMVSINTVYYIFPCFIYFLSFDDFNILLSPRLTGKMTVFFFKCTKL